MTAGWKQGRLVRRMLVGGGLNNWIEEYLVNTDLAVTLEVRRCMDVGDIV